METLQPKTFWILGASGGIGRELVKQLTGEDVTIIASGRNEQRLQELHELNPTIESLAFDATDPKAVGDAAATVFQNHGPIHGVVHLVGSFMLKAAQQLTLDDWRDTMRINLDSAFFLLKSIAGPMQKQGHGSIVFTSTVAAQTGLPSHEAIAAAKAGVDGLVRSAAATYASRNLRVNSVAPGMTETPLSAPILNNDTSRKITERMHPLGRVGQPSEVASAIRWLLSDQAAWVTGQTICVDGGLSNVHPRPRV